MYINELLNSLMVSFENAHPDKMKAAIQKEVHGIWNSLKGEKLEHKELESRIKSFVNSFNEKAMRLKSKHLSFWSKTPKQSASTSFPLEFQKNSTQFLEPADELSIIDDQERCRLASQQPTNRRRC